MTAEALRVRLGTPAWKEARWPTLLGGAVLMAVGAAVAVRLPAADPIRAGMAAALGGVAIWMFMSARYEWTLAVVMLYIGLADGYLKLKTGSQPATLGRDILLYAIVAGAIVRWAIKGERVERPPLTAWVIAWVAVVLVQVFNPANGTFYHSLASLRPHLEWVPLFFLGYMVMRSKRRLRAFLILLLVVAAANGIVGLIQFNMSTEQLASWGPGYEKRITGEGDVSARGFADEEGDAHNRPFALGSDMGFGGAVGVLAVPAALGLLAVGGGLRLPVTLLSAGVVLAVVTSQARVAMIGAVVALLAFAALSVTSRGAFRAVMALSFAVLVTYASVSILLNNSSQGSFDRYSSISPTKAAGTTVEYRKKTFEKLPEYIRDFPLGAGIGSKGPAAGFEGSGLGGQRLNAESQPNYLVIELGVPGLLVMAGFNLALLGLGMRRVRRQPDPELRLLLAAIVAPLLAMVATWVVGVSTATTPGAPYLWFAAGILAYWLVAAPREAHVLSPPPPAAPIRVPRPTRRPTPPPPAPIQPPAPEVVTASRRTRSSGWRRLAELRRALRTRFR